ALADHDLAQLRRRGPGQVRREQVAALVVDLAVGAVEVLRLPPLPHRPGSEAEHAAAAIAQREGDAPPKAPVDAARAVGRALHEPGAQQLRLAEAAAARRVEQAV